VTDQQTSQMTQQEPVRADQRRIDAPVPPPAPGAVRAPHRPGEVPDRSSVPGFRGVSVPPARRPILRPLTQYGTAQELWGVFPKPDEEAEPAEFEQATAAFEERRKAYPWQTPPLEPTPYFALDQGVSPVPPALPGAEETPALAAETK